MLQEDTTVLFHINVISIYVCISSKSNFNIFPLYRRVQLFGKYAYSPSCQELDETIPLSYLYANYKAIARLWLA